MMNRLQVSCRLHLQSAIDGFLIYCEGDTGSEIIVRSSRDTDLLLAKDDVLGVSVRLNST